jgi:membrane-associated phospholipid phosphatase
MVAYARLEKDAHYLSDVTAGAVIGVGVAHSVYGINRGKREGWAAVYPSHDPRSAGFELSVEWPMR